MLVQKILPKHCNNIQKELLNLFHSSGIPMHYNKTGNKEFTNYQRISLIILFKRSKKSLRDFITEVRESLWVKWLGLKKIPGKSTLHDWIKLFKMKTIRQLIKLLHPKKIELTAIDGTGFDSWQRSRHYEKRIGEVQAPQMPYAKADILIDVKTRKILDFSLVCKHQHDIVAANQIFKRFNLNGIIILADRGYDSQPLHEVARERGGILYAPVRKMCKSLRKNPKGRFRKECLNLPDFMGQRSIVESVNYSLKKRQIVALTCRKEYLKKREFAWHVVLYDLYRNISIKNNLVGKATRLNQFIFLLIIEF